MAHTSGGLPCSCWLFTQRLAAQTAHALSLQVNTVVRKLDYFSIQLAWLWEHGDSMAGFHEAVTVAIDTLGPDALVQVGVTDDQGRVRYSNLHWGTSDASQHPAISIADREHFRVHVNAEKPFLFISGPIKGRISQKWTIQFTRGLHRDGKFDGVMTLSVSVEHLAGFLKDIFPNPDDAASLVKGDGTYLARSYYVSDVMGKKLPPSRPFIEHPELTEGRYEIEGMVDDVLRFYSWRRVKEYPLVVLVGLSADDAMALIEKSIHDSHWQSAASSALLLLAGIGLTGLWVQRSRRTAELQRVADALSVETSRLNTVLQRYPGGVIIRDAEGCIVFANAQSTELLGLDLPPEALLGMRSLA